MSFPAGWTQSGNSLVRTIERKTFVEALALVQKIGALAEAANHHPDIDLRYNRVHLSLCTHSAGHKITEKDLDLAQKINALD